MQPPLAAWLFRGFDIELATAFVYGEEGERVEIWAFSVTSAGNFN